MITFYEIAILLFCICTILNLNLKQLAGEKGRGRNLGQLTLQPMAAQEILISRLTNDPKENQRNKTCNFEVNFPLVVYVNVCTVMLCRKAQSFLSRSFPLSTPRNSKKAYRANGKHGCYLVSDWRNICNFKSYLQTRGTRTEYRTLPETTENDSILTKIYLLSLRSL